MLGVKSVHNPITGAVADDIRATLIRMQTGQLNESDLQRNRFQEEEGEFDIVWK